MNQPALSRLCIVCGELKPETNFSFERKGYRRKKCRSCRGEAGFPSCSRQRVRNKRPEYRRRTVSKLRQLIQTLKSSPCSDCGVAYPYYVMDFDHRNPAEKKFSISDFTANIRSVESIMAEIAKCDVVCSNCHRCRTHAQQVSGLFRLARPMTLGGVSE